MRVFVERSIKQVRDGNHYKGHIKIADTELGYELQFAVPIPELDDLEPVEDINEVRRIFLLTVKRDDTEIELTNDEYGFFFQMLAVFALEFYNNPQTRASQEGLIGMTLRNEEGPMAEFVTSASIGITSSGEYDFPLPACRMLSTPKFGCALTT